MKEEGGTYEPNGSISIHINKMDAMINPIFTLYLRLLFANKVDDKSFQYVCVLCDREEREREIHKHTHTLYIYIDRNTHIIVLDALNCLP